MKPLHLNLKRKWFDMILSGQKTEEYRDITDYWVRRFLYSKDVNGWDFATLDEMVGDMQRPNLRHTDIDELMNYFNVFFRQFDTIIFRNGYKKNAPEFTIERQGITVKTGRVEWGAEPGTFYFCLKLGDVIS